MAGESKTPVLKKEIGATGTVSIGGIIVDQDYNSELVGTERIKTVNQMRKGDATVRAALLAVKLPILSAKWFIEAASESEEDQKIKRFVEQNLDNEMTRTWQDFLREALSYLDFGHYVWEIIYKDLVFESKRHIGFHKFAPRLPGTIFAWQTQNGKDGVTQTTVDKGEVSIPIEKLIILTNEKEGDNWEGDTILRSAYKHWYIKDNLYKIDAIAHERQGLGIPFVKHPSSGADSKNKDKARELLKNLRANEQGYAEIPHGWELGFLDMKAKTTREPTESIKHHDRQITKSVLAQWLELGAGSKGSFALSSDHSSLFLLSEIATARYLRDSIQKFAINKLVDFNFNTSSYPQLRFGKIGKIDFESLSLALSRFGQAGFILPDDGLEKHLRDVMELPEMPKGLKTESKRAKFVKLMKGSGDYQGGQKNKFISAVEDLRDNVGKVIEKTLSDKD